MALSKESAGDVKTNKKGEDKMKKLTLSRVMELAREVKESYGKTELVELMSEYNLNEVTIDDLGKVESVFNKKVRDKIQGEFFTGDEEREEKTPLNLELPASLEKIMNTFGKEIGGEIMYAMVTAKTEKLTKDNLGRILYGLNNTKAQSILAETTGTDRILIDTGQDRLLKIFNEGIAKVKAIRITEEENIKHHGYLDTGKKAIVFKTLDSKINSVVFQDEKIPVKLRIAYENIIADLIEELNTGQAEQLTLPVEKEEEVVQKEEITEDKDKETKEPVTAKEQKTIGKFTGKGFESYESEEETESMSDNETDRKTETETEIETEQDQGGEEVKLTHDGYPAVLVTERHFKQLDRLGLLIEDDYHKTEEGYVVEEEVLLHANQQLEELLDQQAAMVKAQKA